MKIMQVVNGFPPGDRSGTPVYVSNLSGELAKRHQVYILYPCEDRNRSRYSVREFQANDLHTFELATNRGPVASKLVSLVSPESTYRNEKVEKTFDATLEDTCPDVVHFQHLTGLSASLVPLCKRKGLPVVLSLHDFWFVCHRAHLLREHDVVCTGPVPGRPPDCVHCQAYFALDGASRLLGRYIGSLSSSLNSRFTCGVFAKAFELIHGKDIFTKRNAYLKNIAGHADVIITPSRFVRDRFVEFGLPEESIVISNNGMDPGIFEGFTRKESVNVRFGVVSPMLVPHKGIHVAVEAFRNLGKRNAELLVWGAYENRSPYFRELTRLAEGANVRFRGTFTDLGVPYSEMDVLVVPSICYETFSLVLHEAFMARIPVIVSGIGALPEFVKNNENGLLFEAGNAADLCGKMRRLLDDPDLISGHRANITRPKTLAEQAADLEEIYAGLMGAGSTRVQASETRHLSR